jgi:hypothetical protein
MRIIKLVKDSDIDYLKQVPDVSERGIFSAVGCTMA